MRISKARFPLFLAAIVGIAGCQSSAPSSWFKFGKKDTAAESALADAPSHSRPSLPSSGASPSGLASNNTATWGTRPDTSNASNSNWGTSWNSPGISSASTAANVPASYNASTYPSTGMQSTASVNNPYAQANNWAAGSGAATANTASATYQPQHGFYDPNAYAGHGAAQQYNIASPQGAAGANQYSAGASAANSVGTYNGYSGATGYSASTPQMVNNTTAASGATPWSSSTGAGYSNTSTSGAGNTYDSGAAAAAATPSGYGAAPGSAYGETQTADSRSAWGNNTGGTYASGATVGSTYTPPAYNYSGANDSSGAWTVGGTGASSSAESSSGSLPQRLGNYRPGGTGDYRPVTGTALGATAPASQPSTAAPANYESGLSQATPAATTVGGSVSAGATSFR